VGGSGGVAVIAMDANDGIEAILARNNGLSAVAPKQALKIIPGGSGSRRGFLDDAIMLDSTTHFLIAVTNRQADDASVGGYTLPAGRSAAFALSADSDGPFQILQAWLLNTGVTLTDVTLKLNPTRQRAWLAATCPPGAAVGHSVCASQNAGRVVLQLPDELNTP
jgi:hypothetical protein